MAGVFRETLGQFGLAGALLVSSAVAYAVMTTDTHSVKNGSTFATIGSRIDSCQMRGVDTPMGRLGCDMSQRELDGTMMLKVRNVRTMSFSSIFGDQ